MEIFRDELRKFKENSTSVEQAAVGHLIGKNHGSDSESEIAAESNMLLSATEPAMGLRALYFSQYFPRTIAKIGELLDKKMQNFA